MGPAVVFPPLHAILDVDAAAQFGWRPPDLAVALLDGGATFIQVRAKHLASGPFLQLCDLLLRIAEPYEAAVIVNDRADLAWMSRAAGVHLGQDDLPPGLARRLLGPDAIVGWSTHTLPQIDAAIEHPVSYIAVGPVFATTSKQTGYHPVGLELVRTAAERAGGVPIVAIGGITLDTAPDVLRAGATSVAVIGDLLVAADVRERVRRYVQRLGQYRV